MSATRGMVKRSLSREREGVSRRANRNRIQHGVRVSTLGKIGVQCCCDSKSANMSGVANVRSTSVESTRRERV